MNNKFDELTKSMAQSVQGPTSRYCVLWGYSGQGAYAGGATSVW
jgi:hypothetical protein